MKLTDRQKTFLKAFEKHATNISQACKAVGIDRSTHYTWITTNPTYKEKIEHIEDGMIDFAESMLFKNMKAGKETSTLFFLKTRGRKRGYIEKQEFDIEHSGKTNMKVTFE